MTAMQNSISQLAQSMQTRPSPGSKGQGNGKPPKGQGKGTQPSPGERKNPNLKPVEEHAMRTTEEIKCLNCPTHNWTTRSVCRSCGHKLLQGNSHKTPPTRMNPGQASAKPGEGGPSFASVAKRETGPAENPKKKRTPSKKRQSPSKNCWPQ